MFINKAKKTKQQQQQKTEIRDSHLYRKATSRMRSIVFPSASVQFSLQRIFMTNPTNNTSKRTQSENVEYKKISFENLFFYFLLKK